MADQLEHQICHKYYISPLRPLFRVQPRYNYIRYSDPIQFGFESGLLRSTPVESGPTPVNSGRIRSDSGQLRSNPV